MQRVKELDKAGATVLNHDGDRQSGALMGGRRSNAVLRAKLPGCSMPLRPFSRKTGGCSGIWQAWHLMIWRRVWIGMKKLSGFRSACFAV